MQQADELNLPGNSRSPAEQRSYLDAQAQADVQVMFAAQSDLQGFGALYEAYAPMIYAYCRRRTGSKEEAEDICSQVFIRALKGIHTFRGGLVAAWLYRIAHNEIANYYRKQRYLLPYETSIVMDDEHDFQDEVEQESARQTLAKLVNELPQEHRDLLSMSLVEGLTSPQIGHLLRQSPITVRTRLRRIKHSLQTRYLTVIAEPAHYFSN